MKTNKKKAFIKTPSEIRIQICGSERGLDRDIYIWRVGDNYRYLRVVLRLRLGQDDLNVDVAESDWKINNYRFNHG